VKILRFKLSLTNYPMVMFKVLFIGGSTGTMLESLQLVGENNCYHRLYEVSRLVVCSKLHFASQIHHHDSLRIAPAHFLLWAGLWVGVL
jgi:hypothetical protein